MSRPPPVQTKRAHALALLGKRGMTRLLEFREVGITAATISRLEREGQVVRVARGLYQLTHAPLDRQHALAKAAKLIPRGVICLASALAYHGLIDQMPSQVWIAIGRKDWRPRLKSPPVRITRFPDRLLRSGVEQHEIEGSRVSIYGIAKTIADVFRYRRIVGDSLAVEGLCEALRRGKVTPPEIALHASESGTWKTIEPYVTALISDA
jgi:predicted transcriptional regulator of viral defense system